MAKWAAICVALIACGGSNGSKHPAGAKHDAAHDPTPKTHDAGAHDAAVDARAMQSGDAMTSAPDAAADAAAPAICADLSLAIAQKVFEAINTANNTNQCTTDADCVTLRALHNSCYDGCPFRISNNGSVVVDLELKTIERNTCPEFIQNGCTFSQPTCPTPPPLGCRDGRCQVLSASAGQTCGNLQRSVSDRVTQAAALADRHCLIDTDCTVVIPGNPCFSNCESELILSNVGAASVQDAVDAATLEICPGFFANGCELGTATCEPPKMQAKCIGGTCGPAPGR